MLAEIATAEAAAAEARERAKAARARAQELRRKAAEADAADKAPVTAASETATEDDIVDGDIVDGDEPSDLPTPRRGLRGLWGWKGLVIAAAALIACGSIALTTVMVLAHREEVRSERMAATYSETAEDLALTLMAMDYTRAQDNVQEIIDVTTGKLREQWQGEADNIVHNMEEAKVVTKAAVIDSAVESMDANQAVVLLAIRTQRTSADEAADPNQPLPTLWRLALTLVHEGGQIKVSNLEYV